MFKFQCAVLLLGVFFVVGCGNVGPKWHVDKDLSDLANTEEGYSTGKGYLANDHSNAMVSVMTGAHYRLLCQYAIESYALLHNCPIRYGKNLEYCAYTNKFGELTLVLKVNDADKVTWMMIGSKGRYRDDAVVESLAQSVGLKVDLHTLQSRPGRNLGAITEIDGQFIKLPDKWIELSNALGGPPSMYANTVILDGSKEFIDIGHRRKHAAASGEFKPLVRYSRLIIPLRGPLADFYIKLDSDKLQGKYKTEVEGFMKNLRLATLEELSQAVPPEKP